VSDSSGIFFVLQKGPKLAGSVASTRGTWSTNPGKGHKASEEYLHAGHAATAASRAAHTSGSLEDHHKAVASHEAAKKLSPPHSIAEKGHDRAIREHKDIIHTKSKVLAAKGAEHAAKEKAKASHAEQQAIFDKLKAEGGPTSVLLHLHEENQKMKRRGPEHEVLHPGTPEHDRAVEQQKDLRREKTLRGQKGKKSMTTEDPPDLQKKRKKKPLVEVEKSELPDWFKSTLYDQSKIRQKNPVSPALKAKAQKMRTQTAQAISEDASASSSEPKKKFTMNDYKQAKQTQLGEKHLEQVRRSLTKENEMDKSELPEWFQQELIRKGLWKQAKKMVSGGKPAPAKKFTSAKAPASEELSSAEAHAVKRPSAIGSAFRAAADNKSELPEWFQGVNPANRD
jgi:hypothetical protein